MKQILAWGAGALLCALVLIADQPEMSYVVETTVVKPIDIFSVERRYIGTIHAEKFSILMPAASGTVSGIHVAPGQKVKKGQLLISLQGGVEKRALELAEQHLRSVKSERDRNRALYKSQDVTKSQMEKFEREVLLAESKLEEQRRLLEKVEIRSPFDGVAGVPRVVLGETVQSTSPVITVMDGPFSVFVHIPASRLAEVKVGQKIRLKTFTTTINAVEKSIDPTTRMGFAKAIFPICETCIIGDSVYVNIVVHEKPQAILVSRNAVFYKHQKPYVVVVVKEADLAKAQIKEVVLGEEQDGQVEITSGLKDGDEVVVANPKRLPEAATVTVLR